MSARPKVLAVLDAAIAKQRVRIEARQRKATARAGRGKPGLEYDHQADHSNHMLDGLTEARAAVAELIEAATDVLETGFYTAPTPSRTRLRAAIAKVQP